MKKSVTLKSKLAGSYRVLFLVDPVAVFQPLQHLVELLPGPFSLALVSLLSLLVQVIKKRDRDKHPCQ